MILHERAAAVSAASLRAGMASHFRAHAWVIDANRYIHMINIRDLFGYTLWCGCGRVVCHIRYDDILT
jgi:hypothetical protein